MNNDFLFIINYIISLMRKSTSFASIVSVKRKTSASHFPTSIINSRLSLSHCTTQNGLRPTKGFSFGSSPRNNLMSINLVSPAAKYNIKGIVEINLAKKKGPSMSSGRQNSVEKTNLSYVHTNANPGPAAYQTQSFYKSTSSIKIGRSKNENVLVEFLNDKAINQNPGPGAYHSKVVKLKGGKLNGSSKRFMDDKENRPGPGTYNINYIDQDAICKGATQSKNLKINVK